MNTPLKQEIKMSSIKEKNKKQKFRKEKIHGSEKKAIFQKVKDDNKDSFIIISYA